MSSSTPAPLPAPGGASYRIAMVCLGNICRSPTAQVVLSAQLADAGLGDRVEVTSAGTGDWHVGDPMDRRAAAELAGSGYDPTAHRARQFDDGWFDHDLVLVMDAQNLQNVAALGGSPGQVRMFRSFDPDGGPESEVPDPWHGGPEGFTEVLAMVERTCRVLVAELRHLLD